MQAGHPGTGDGVDTALDRRRRRRQFAVGSERPGPHRGDPGPQGREVEAAGPGVELGTAGGRRVSVARAQLGLDQHGEQLGGAQLISAKRS